MRDFVYEGLDLIVGATSSEPGDPDRSASCNLGDRY